MGDDASSSNRRPRLLVIGNGPTGVAADGAAHVDRSCGQFLEELAAHAKVVFAQPVEEVEASLNFYGHVIDTGRVEPLLLDRRTGAGVVSGLRDLVVAIARADFIHLFFPGTLPRLAGRICRMMRKPYGLFMRGSQFGEARLDRTLIGGAQLVLCVSEAIAEQISSINSRAMVVRSAQDLRAEDGWQRPRDAGAQGPLGLLYVGRIDEEKGIPELIEAARLLHEEKFDFRLTLVGFGRLGRELSRDLAADPDLPVTYLGAIGDRGALMQLFRDAQVFVLPSHHEGFARVLYEAMLQSCAIVSTMVGGIPAVLKDGANCLAVPVGDATAIAAAVRRLGQDPALRSQLAASGFKTVLDTIARVPTHAEVLRQHLAEQRRGTGPHQHSFQN